MQATLRSNLKDKNEIVIYFPWTWLIAIAPLKTNSEVDTIKQEGRVYRTSAFLSA